jgi:hypothetical protein
MCDARKVYSFVLQEIDEVICGRLTFDVGGEGENNLGELFFFRAIDQLFDAQIFGTNMIER